MVLELSRRWVQKQPLKASIIGGAFVFSCFNLVTFFIGLRVTHFLGDLLLALLMGSLTVLLLNSVLRFSLEGQDAQTHVAELERQLGILSETHKEIQVKYITIQEQQAQKLESLGSLASGVAHDLNNVLAVILGMVETHPTIPTKVSSSITSACIRGKGVVQSLMYFSKGSLDTVDKLNLNHIVRSALKKLPFLPTTLITDLPDIPFIDGDAHALEHAVTHLLVNSMDALTQDPSGVIILKTYVLNGHVFLTVQDTGVGMSPEVLSKATEPFFSTKAQGRCSGLGLASVKSTVLAHSGDLHIASVLGEGTSVTLSFPASEIVVLPRAEINSESLQIMVVDDDELIRMSFSALLEMMGHSVISLSSGYDAIRQFEAGVRPQILIIDMYMPGMSADIVIPRLLTICPEQRILLASGAQTDAIDVILRAYPQVTKISKPFSARELEEHVKYLCKGE